MKKIGRWVIAVMLAGLLAFPSVGSAGTMTASVTERQNFGSLFVIFATLTFSASYAAGGDTVVAGDLGITDIVHIQPDPVTNNGLLVAPNLATATKRLKALIAGGTNSAPTIDCTSAATGTYVQGNQLGISTDANGAVLDCGTAARTGILGINASTFTGGAAVESSGDLSTHTVAVVVYGR